MKRLSTLLSLLCWALFLPAQQLLVVSGTVTQNGAALGGHPVTIWVGDSLPFQSMVLTNPNGFFIDSLTVTHTQGVVLVSTQCGFLTLLDTLYWSPNQLTLNSQLDCSNASGNCLATFTTQALSLNTYQFTAQPQGMAPFTYQWTTSDGGSYTTANPVHTFAQGGWVDVCLTITDNTGCADSTCQQIFILNPNPCSAVFSYSALGGNAIQFVPDSANFFQSYSWDFGDNNISQSASPAHTYANPGTYYVCLTVNDNNGCVDTWCDSVTVQGTGSGNCQAAFSMTVGPNGLVHFQNQSSGGNPQGNYTSQWNFGDGNNSSQQNPAHTYLMSGTYMVCLTIFNPNNNCVDSVCQSVTVIVNGTNCFSGWNATNLGGLTYHFQPVAPSNNYFYTWDFGDNNFSNQASPTHTYAQSGNYLVRLIVDDLTNNCTDTTTGYLLVQTPTCNALFAVQQIQNTFAYFINQSVANNPQNNYSSHWDFGDGTSSTVKHPTHNFVVPGNYNVCLTITDPNTGCVDSFCQVVQILGNNPNCLATWSADSIQGFTYQFTPDTLINGLDYFWSFGDGSGSQQAVPVHSYNQPGAYVVCLTVVDSNSNCAATHCDTLLVGVTGSPCIASFNLNQPGNLIIQFNNTSQGGTPLDPLQAYWDFGDGNSSTSFSPTHTYAQSGTYQVCLSVFNTNCADTLCAIITVGNQPPCNATWTGLDLGNLSYLFLPDSIVFPANTQLLWDFGDGHTSNQAAPTHTYAQPGAYLVCLTVIDNLTGCLDTHCDSVFVNNQPGVCQAGFAFSVVGTSAQFYNLSYSSNPPLAYHWDFGDGSTANSANPQHTFAQAQPYTVCLIISDATGCTDTVCQVVPLDTLNQPYCDAYFIWHNTGNQIVAFNSLSPQSGLTYSWDFGDGNSSQTAAPIHTYANTGIYYACLTVTDSLTGCIDTYCDSVYVIGLNPFFCHADFIYFTQGGNTVSFLDLSTSANAGGITSWLWDFGDSTTSTLQHPTHTYPGVGPYFACLTITDSAGCSSTHCLTILPTPIINSGYQISGVVVADSSMIYNGIVYLIQHDTVAGTLTAVDSTYIGQSFYTFFNVSPGTYLVKAALLPPSPVYSNYLPTYLGDVLYWNNAISTVVTNSNILNPPIHLVAGNNPGGPGFIGGLISQGANKVGDPLVGLSVLLLDDQGNPITHMESDADGRYRFENLAYGTYIVHVEVPGKISEDWWVTISPNQPNMTLADFEVTSTHVWALGNNTAIDPDEARLALRLAPNPTQGLLGIELELAQQTELGIALYDAMGQKLLVQEAKPKFGKQQMELDLSALPAGTYLLQLSLDGKLVHRRILKQ